MRILQLCKKFPYPLKDGESIAVTYLAKAMNALGCEVTLLAMNTTKHPVQVPKVRHELSHYKSVYYTRLDNEVKALHAFLNLFSSDSYNISRFDNNAFRGKLRQVLKKQKFDIIQLESLYLTPYIDIIRQYSKAKIVLRAHNVEHEIWERMAENEEVAIRRWYLDYSARKLKKYEIDQLETIDMLVPISSVDHHKFLSLGFKGHSYPMPIGLEMSDFPFQRVEEDSVLSLSFIGSLDWMPNLEALNWFLDQVWPMVNATFPRLKLFVAGRNCPDWIRNLQVENLEVVGEVESSTRFLSEHPISVVPILSGSGMRAKILEAMALGRVVVTSTVGLEGIPARDKEHVLIADTPEAFLRSFTFCHRHKRHLPSISDKARGLTEEYFDHIEIARQLITAYEGTMV